VASLILDDASRRVLLQIAREAIRSRLERDTRHEDTARGTTHEDTARGTRHEDTARGLRHEARGTEDRLSIRCPAFVTLRRGDQLRGCIGHVESDRPLAEVIARAAVAAAFEDPRFTPVTLVEFDQISIEISVLGPMQPVSDPSTIEVGRHGLVVHSGTKRGLLLPQVPAEWGWDRETYLDQACAKAGLARGAWRTGAEILCFEADVFSEGDLPT
jgi:AmmeMemoRadiSam system protein A